MGSVKNVKTNKCHDCGKEVKITNDEIKNGHLLIYDDNGEKINILKCDKCFKNNPGLTNFRDCEVYSRVVGYLRPISQWNKGKQEEYKDRIEYKL